MSITRRAASAVVVVALLAPSCAFRDQLSRRALRPRAEFAIVPADYGLTPELLWVPTDGAQIHAWLFHAADAVGTIVICNGNAGNKQVYLPSVPYFLAAGYEVVLFDYRGFGLSTGTPDLFALADDTARVVDAVRARDPARPLALFGVSLGSAIAVLVARERPDAIRALVLESAFSPREACHRMAGKRSALCPLLVPGRLEVRRQLPKLEQPLLMLHGEADRISPVAVAAEMYRDAARRHGAHEFWLAAGAGHSPDVFGQYGPVYLRRIAEFLETHFAASRSAASPSPPSAVWSAGAVEARFPREGLLPGARTPVELSMVEASGKTATHHLWLEPGGDPTVRVAVESRPVLASARVVHDPVEGEGDGWSYAELLAARRIEAQRQRLSEALGTEYRPLAFLMHELHPPGAQGEHEWKPLVMDSPEGRAAKAAELLDQEEDVRAAAEAARTAEDAARAVDLLAQYAAALELVDRPDAARDLYRVALARLPERAHAILLYRDGSWAIGLGWTIRAVFQRSIELARTPQERERLLLALGEWTHAEVERRRGLACWMQAERPP